MLYFSYRIGQLILGVDDHADVMVWHLDTLYDNFKHIWRPLVLGSLISGLVAGIIGFIGIRVLWTIQVRRSWIKRGRERLKRQQLDQNNDPN